MTSLIHNKQSDMSEVESNNNIVVSEIYRLRTIQGLIRDHCEIVLPKSSSIYEGPPSITQRGDNLVNSDGLAVVNGDGSEVLIYTASHDLYCKIKSAHSGILRVIQSSATPQIVYILEKTHVVAHINWHLLAQSSFAPSQRANYEQQSLPLDSALYSKFPLCVCSVTGIVGFTVLSLNTASSCTSSSRIASDIPDTSSPQSLSKSIPSSPQFGSPLRRQAPPSPFEDDQVLPATPEQSTLNNQGDSSTPSNTKPLKMVVRLHTWQIICIQSHTQTKTDAIDSGNLYRWKRVYSIDLQPLQEAYGTTPFISSPMMTRTPASAGSTRMHQQENVSHIAIYGPLVVVSFGKTTELRTIPRSLCGYAGIQKPSETGSVSLTGTNQSSIREQDFNDKSNLSSTTGTQINNHYVDCEETFEFRAQPELLAMVYSTRAEQPCSPSKHRSSSNRFQGFSSGEYDDNEVPERFSSFASDISTSQPVLSRRQRQNETNSVLLFSRRETNPQTEIRSVQLGMECLVMNDIVYSMSSAETAYSRLPRSRNADYILLIIHTSSHSVFYRIRLPWLPLSHSSMSDLNTSSSHHRSYLLMDVNAMYHASFENETENTSVNERKAKAISSVPSPMAQWTMEFLLAYKWSSTESIPMESMVFKAPFLVGIQPFVVQNDQGPYSHSTEKRSNNFDQSNDHKTNVVSVYYRINTVLICTSLLSRQELTKHLQQTSLDKPGSSSLQANKRQSSEPVTSIARNLDSCSIVTQSACIASPASSPRLISRLILLQPAHTQMCGPQLLIVPTQTYRSWDLKSDKDITSISTYLPHDIYDHDLASILPVMKQLNVPKDKWHDITFIQRLLAAHSPKASFTLLGEIQLLNVSRILKKFPEILPSVPNHWCTLALIFSMHDNLFSLQNLSTPWKCPDQALDDENSVCHSIEMSKRIIEIAQFDTIRKSFLVFLERICVSYASNSIVSKQSSTLLHPLNFLSVLLFSVSFHIHLSGLRSAQIQLDEEIPQICKHLLDLVSVQSKHAQSHNSLSDVTSTIIEKLIFFLFASCVKSVGIIPQSLSLVATDIPHSKLEASNSIQHSLDALVNQKAFTLSQNYYPYIQKFFIAIYDKAFNASNETLSTIQGKQAQFLYQSLSSSDTTCDHDIQAVEQLYNIFRRCLLIGSSPSYVLHHPMLSLVFVLSDRVQRMMQKHRDSLHALLIDESNDLKSSTLLVNKLSDYVIALLFCEMKKTDATGTKQKQQTNTNQARYESSVDSKVIAQCLTSDIFGHREFVHMLQVLTNVDPVLALIVAYRIWCRARVYLRTNTQQSFVYVQARIMLVILAPLILRLFLQYIYGLRFTMDETPTVVSGRVGATSTSNQSTTMDRDTAFSNETIEQAVSATSGESIQTSPTAISSTENTFVSKESLEDIEPKPLSLPSSEISNRVAETDSVDMFQTSESNFSGQNAAILPVERLAAHLECMSTPIPVAMSLAQQLYTNFGKKLLPNVSSTTGIASRQHVNASHESKQKCSSLSEQIELVVATLLNVLQNIPAEAISPMSSILDRFPTHPITIACRALVLLAKWEFNQAFYYLVQVLRVYPVLSPLLEHHFHPQAHDSSYPFYTKAQTQNAWYYALHALHGNCVSNPSFLNSTKPSSEVRDLHIRPTPPPRPPNSTSTENIDSSQGHENNNITSSYTFQPYVNVEVSNDTQTIQTNSLDTMGSVQHDNQFTHPMDDTFPSASRKNNSSGMNSSDRINSVSNTESMATVDNLSLNDYKAGKNTGQEQTTRVHLSKSFYSPPNEFIFRTQISNSSRKDAVAELDHLVHRCVEIWPLHTALALLPDELEFASVWSSLRNDTRTKSNTKS